MKIEELKDKKILILGLQREGRDSLIFLRKFLPEKIIGIADQKSLSGLEEKSRQIIKQDKNLKLYLGERYLRSLSQYDIIFKSPGVPFKKIDPFLTEKQEISSQTKIFLHNCQGTVVGITGTKGKSTTSSLTYEILKRGGLKVYLVGNIGEPVLSYLSESRPNHIYVYELSSHQLASTKQSPRIAILLNIFQEHLDYYRNIEEYIQAKANIARFQMEKDYLIFNSTNKIVKEIAQKSRAQKIPIKACLNFQLDESQIPLKGKFNLLNIRAASEVGKIFKVPEKKIIQAIKNFKPLPHRLEYVGKYKGIRFYNDSLSTLPEATLRALKTLGEDVETIILGGFERNQNFEELCRKTLASQINNIILFPTTGKRIEEKIRKIGKSDPEFGKRIKTIKIFPVQDMEEAVNLAFNHTQKDKICLLSPAAPSFGVFKDYKERGELFKKYIKGS